MTIISQKNLLDKMSRAVVGIAGLGGLGSNLAVALARTGIGGMILVDHDCVEISNLNRQQYFLSQVGKLKTDALKENILQINQNINLKIVNSILNEHNSAEIFNNADIIAECFDSIESKTMLANVFFKNLNNKKLVAVSGLAGTGPADEIKTLINTDNFALVGDGKTDVADNPVLIASRVGIAALYQANQIIRWIINEN